jgi:nucleotide-binding universal stress UspA family protein
MKILLPVDGSALALDAVHHALQLVRNGLNASFVLANVQEPTYLYEMMLAPNSEVLEGVSGAAGHHALEQAKALLSDAGVPFECEIASGDPAHTLIDIAERFGCDAVIMGARGVGALRGALLGSVSQTVLHDATVPVTIVRHVEPDPAEDDAMAGAAED